MPRPTINDVARAAGVSKGAVSFAFNNRTGLAPETRARILAVAGEMGWTPSSRARALSVSRALAVGLVMARPPETLRADPFFPSFIAGVESELSRHGYALLLQVVPEHEGEQQSYRRLSDEGRVDGVFVTDLHVDDARPALLAELGLPAVIVGPALPEAFWPSVGVDDGPGIVAAVEHLADLRGTPGSPTCPARPRWCTAGPDATPGRPPCTRRTSRGPLRRGRLLRRGRGRCHPGAAGPRRPADRDRLRQRPDGDRRPGRRRRARRRRPSTSCPSTGYEDTELAAHLQPPLTTVSTDVIGWGRAAASAAARARSTSAPPPTSSSHRRGWSSAARAAPFPHARP